MNSLENKFLKKLKLLKISSAATKSENSRIMKGFKKKKGSASHKLVDGSGAFRLRLLRLTFLLG